MEMIADGLLIAGAITASFYCWVLSVRVKALSNLDVGLGCAITTLSGKVDEVQTALAEGQSAAVESTEKLMAATQQANEVLRKLDEFTEAEFHSGFQKKSTSSENVEAFPEEKETVKPKDIASWPLKPATSAVSEVSSISKAQELRKGVKDRLSQRGNSEEREELVRALHDILAAN